MLSRSLAIQVPLFLIGIPIVTKGVQSFEIPMGEPAPEPFLYLPGLSYDPNDMLRKKPLVIVANMVQNS